MENFMETTPWRTKIPENVTVIQLVKRSCLKVTTRFITVFTKAWHETLSWMKPTQSMPLQPVCNFLHLLTCVSKFSERHSGFPTKILYPHLFFLTRPPHPPWFHQISIPIFGDKYKIRLLSLWNSFHHYGSSILVGTRFSIIIHALLIRTHHPSYLYAEAFQYFHSLNVFDFVRRSETLQFMVHYLPRNTHVSPSVSYNSRPSSRKKYLSSLQIC